jgi:hypothetical protein
MEEPTLNNNDNGTKLFKGVIRFNSKYLGLVIGLFLGLTIFVATNWLLIKARLTPVEERAVGPHLQLLSQFFIGYRVSFLGSIIGFLYGFGIGSLIGATIAFVYNKIVDLKQR